MNLESPPIAEMEIVERFVSKHADIKEKQSLKILALRVAILDNGVTRIKKTAAMEDVMTKICHVAQWVTCTG